MISSYLWMATRNQHRLGKNIVVLAEGQTIYTPILLVLLLPFPSTLYPLTHTHGGLSQVDIHSSPQCVIRHAKRLDSVLNRMRMCGSWQMAISSRHTEKLLRKAVIDADWDHTIWSVSSDRDQVQAPVKHVPFTLHRTHRSLPTTHRAGLRQWPERLHRHQKQEARLPNFRTPSRIKSRNNIP